MPAAKPVQSVEWIPWKWSIPTARFCRSGWPSVKMSGMLKSFQDRLRAAWVRSRGGARGGGRPPLLGRFARVASLAGKMLATTLRK
jgi:hypothetical protein